MYIGLFKVKPIIKPGYYPQIDENNVIKYQINDSSIPSKLSQIFFDYINEECGTLVAQYEYDFINPQQCVKLKEWILNNSNLIEQNNLGELFEVINNYCEEAIKLDTGIEIDL